MERRTSGSGAQIRTLLATVTVTVAAAALAGCAAGAATAGPGGQPTPTTRHTPAKTPTPTGTPTALPKASCGRASTHGLNTATQVLSADKGSLTCFQAAARACKTASLAVTEMGVDTGTNHVFAIEPGGKGCAVTDLSQGYSANFGGSHSKIGTTQCTVATVTGGGVTLACGGEKVLIPATVTRL
ncbi:hypothetical protein EAS64_22705 [Trebonia kvetii]|uniref:Uncharacterized protein n=1 Tax=Trebonia kvetii TaxID=2480626 RepID=A0A6P2BVW6_9ACTN|nr:hypothetical protein [Trebonia kvetii]TVZ03242.1 hypothetical protein EAS64_22705 [Trebonia kvetii]